ncbi:MAG: hypothetical protein K1W24_03295 [Lachnospiraceae bacterium]
MDSIKKNDIKVIKEHALDMVKSVLVWAVITGLAFLYWMAVFLIFSLILLNVWHVKFDSILKYAIVLTIITSIVYIVKKIHKIRK